MAGENDTQTPSIGLKNNQEILSNNLEKTTLEGQDEDEDNSAASGIDDNRVNETTTTKKKKPKKKKPSKKKITQTSPPTIGLSKLFPSGQYPIGQCHPYEDETNKYRSSSKDLEEKELKIMQSEDTFNDIRRAAEVHRTVRQYAQTQIKPGMSMTEIAELIENGTRAVVEENGFQSGIGFPTGLSLNNCAAHYTPNAGDKIVLKEADMLKVDFGVHVNGRIVDSAFTLNFEPTYDRLKEAVKDATDTGIRHAGIDARLADIGTAIQEVMESYEVEVGSTTHQVKTIRNLSGHSINKYEIHGGKSVPICAPSASDAECDDRMEEGEYYAIETFGSTGRGYVLEQGDCSHYARMKNVRVPLKLQSSKALLGVIEKNFGTLPFCRRYLDRIGQQNYLLPLRELVREGVVQSYPPLCDIEGSMTAQYEHTILLRPTCKEVVSRGDDY